MRYNRKLTISLLLVVCIVLVSFCSSVIAASNPQKNGVVSLAFDDCLQSQYQYAWPIMHSKGVVGTFYVVSDWVSYSPKFCITIPQLRDLFAQGNEIGSHTTSHPNLLTLDESEIRRQLADSKVKLESILTGLTVRNFAYPYEAGNATVDQIVKEYYRSARYGSGIMSLPYTDFQVLHYTSYSTNDTENYLNYKAIVDQTRKSKGWVVLYFHEVRPLTSDQGSSFSTESFSRLIDYILSKHMGILTVNQALNIRN